MVSIRKELAEYGLTPRKGWGQHFLIDRNILNRVIETAEVGKEDVVLEVGPGLGEMTLLLADRVQKVVAVEIDPRLAERLRQKAKDHPNVEVVQKDILKVNFDQFVDRRGTGIKVVANLPYQITTPLLFRFIDSRHLFSSLTLMVQREVAERLAAPAGGKEYGPLSIFVQVVSDLSIRFFVKPASFFPRPKVDSAVIRMVWREKPLVDLRDEDWFKKVVKGCLGYRRKTLANALKHSGLSLPDDLEGRLERIDIDSRRRPETLTIEEFGGLAEALKTDPENDEEKTG
jgi:16S rRNA (adenine1518-N6/adenine1519-N6)-dimethyltransferase